MKRYGAVFSRAAAVIIAAAMLPVTVFAAGDTADVQETGVKAVSLEEAVAMAVQKNSSLKELDDSIPVLQDKRTKLGFSLYGIQIDENTDTSFNITETTVFAEDKLADMRAMSGYDMQLKKIPYQKLEITEPMEEAAYSYLSTIITAGDSLATTKKLYELQKDSLKASKTSFENGLITAADYTKQQKGLDSLEKNIKMLEYTLNSAKNSLRSFAGMSAGEEFTISLDYKYEPLASDFDINGLIDERISKSPKVALLELGVEESRVFMHAYPASGSIETSLQKQTAVKQAERALSDYRESIRENMESLYSRIKTLERTIAENETSLMQAQRSYEDAKVSYQSGIMSALQFRQIELSVETAQNTLKSNQLKHRQYQLQLVKYI